MSSAPFEELFASPPVAMTVVFAPFMVIPPASEKIPVASLTEKVPPVAVTVHSEIAIAPFVKIP